MPAQLIKDLSDVGSTAQLEYLSERSALQEILLKQYALKLDEYNERINQLSDALQLVALLCGNSQGENK